VVGQRASCRVALHCVHCISNKRKTSTNIERQTNYILNHPSLPSFSLSFYIQKLIYHQLLQHTLPPPRPRPQTMAEYKLSASLAGHEDDVSIALFQGEGQVLTSSLRSAPSFFQTQKLSSPHLEMVQFDYGKYCQIAHLSSMRQSPPIPSHLSIPSHIFHQALLSPKG